ncbi:tRNA wybutosine-synthesizing protein 3 homolog [Amphiura filiformis]|uniref:tRNA wybutosine-synthesizing protein 3 homolog n=1 Tax=Amphiura filiformis TaxID=82378 RepID=UPI003B223807
MEFLRQKNQRLLAEDLSRKGSIDDEISDLVFFINDQEQFFTTSSCSGRIAIFSENTENSKKGCHWLLISHKKTEFEEVRSCIYDSTLDSTAVFKYEPFVLHVQCRTLEDAKLMHQVAVESGFRNSGITIGKNGKIMMAVRSTHGLEVPLANDGTVLVSKEYVAYLVDIANSKMMENSRRIERFFSNLKQAIAKYTQANTRKATKSQEKQRLKEIFRDTAAKHQATQCDTVQTTCPHNSHGLYCQTCCDQTCVENATKSGQCKDGRWVSDEDGGDAGRNEKIDESKPPEELDDLEISLQLLGVDS